MERLVSIRDQWALKIFDKKSLPFEMLALEAFTYQSFLNPVYSTYIKALGIDPSTVNRLEKIPFLPIRFFKSHQVVSGGFAPSLVFESSATTGMTTSKHYLKDPNLYQQSFNEGFFRQFGPVENWCILGLLPSYLERNNSSLTYMTHHLIEASGHPKSGFYLDNVEALSDTIRELEAVQQPTLLIGVTFALLDFAARFPMPLQCTQIIETGGMKGRRRELIRAEVHAILQEAFHLPNIYAEYGMTELLSQAWSAGEGIFNCPSWMRVLPRDEEDPLTIHSSGPGALNIIDLANIDSCCFIATDDAGKVYPDGRFEMLGRMDGSDLRGCSLLTA
ncbi:MAG: acyl transferase [Chitinophagaceae bacterium]